MLNKFCSSCSAALAPKATYAFSAASEVRVSAGGFAACDVIRETRPQPNV